jgi:hypothetical protein
VRSGTGVPVPLIVIPSAGTSGPGGNSWRAPRNPTVMRPNARRSGGACARRPNDQVAVRPGPPPAAAIPVKADVTDTASAADAAGCGTWQSLFLSLPSYAMPAEMSCPLRNEYPVIAETFSNKRCSRCKRRSMDSRLACGIETETGRPEVNDLGEFGVGFQQAFAGDAWFQAQQRIRSDSSNVAVSSGRSRTG